MLPVTYIAIIILRELSCYKCISILPDFIQHDTYTTQFYNELKRKHHVQYYGILIHRHF